MPASSSAQSFADGSQSEPLILSAAPGHGRSQPVPSALGRRRMYGVELVIIILATLGCALVSSSPSISSSTMLIFCRVLMVSLRDPSSSVTRGDSSRHEGHRHWRALPSVVGHYV